MSSNLHIAVLLTLLGLVFTWAGLVDLCDSGSGPLPLTIRTVQTILWRYVVPGITSFLIPPVLIGVILTTRHRPDRPTDG